MIITKDEFEASKERFFEHIHEKAVFIYPTDTIYGIGCNATNSIAVKRVQEIKNRKDKPFSVIAPTKDWIRRNCKVDEESLKKLPGPYTLILPLKNKDAVCKEINLDDDTLGVRIPAHWISEIVAELGFPIVTTSVNKSDEKPMNKIEDLDEDIKKKVDFIIYDGPINGKRSEIINLTEELS